MADGIQSISDRGASNLFEGRAQGKCSHLLTKKALSPFALETEAPGNCKKAAQVDERPPVDVSPSLA